MAAIQGAQLPKAIPALPRKTGGKEQGGCAPMPGL